MRADNAGSGVFVLLLVAVVVRGDNNDPGDGDDARRRDDDLGVIAEVVASIAAEVFEGVEEGLKVVTGGGEKSLAVLVIADDDNNEKGVEGKGGNNEEEEVLDAVGETSSACVGGTSMPSLLPTTTSSPFTPPAFSFTRACKAVSVAFITKASLRISPNAARSAIPSLRSALTRASVSARPIASPAARIRSKAASFTSDASMGGLRVVEARPELRGDGSLVRDDDGKGLEE